MAEGARELDSNAIRHLILKTKLGEGRIGDIGRNVVYMAVKDGLLSDASELAYEHPLAQVVMPFPCPFTAVTGVRIPLGTPSPCP
jgi:hypothetical protein